MTRSPSSQQRFAGTVSTTIVGWVKPFDGVYPELSRMGSGSAPRNPSIDMDCAVVCLLKAMGIGARRLDPSYFLTRFPQLFVDLREKDERCHNEIGAPDYRICIPFGVVLTPWDQNLFPVFGPVATAQEDSWRLERVKSRPVSAFGCCGFA